MKTKQYPFYLVEVVTVAVYLSATCMNMNITVFVGIVLNFINKFIFINMKIIVGNKIVRTVTIC